MTTETREHTCQTSYATTGVGLYGESFWDFTVYASPIVYVDRISGYRGKKVSNARHNVTHEKLISAKNFDITLPLTANYLANGFSSVTITNGVISPIGGADFSGLSYETMLNDLVMDASGAMPTGTNLVVNVAEVASLKALAKGIISGLRSYKTWPNKIKKMTAKDLANSHLSYSFGIKPLLTDIAGLFDYKSIIEKRINELESRSGKPVRITKRSQETHSASSNSVWAEGNTVHEIRFNNRFSYKTELALSASVLAYTFDDDQTRAKAWCAATGITTPFSNVWALIPFSFVVDWIYPVSEKIARSELSLLNNGLSHHVDISDWVFSVKQFIDTTSVGRVVSTHYPGWNRKAGHASYAVSVYQRSVGIPAGTLNFLPSGWSLSRSALSISLAIQRAR